jgi:hypothetical protein
MYVWSIAIVVRRVSGGHDLRNRNTADGLVRAQKDAKASLETSRSLPSNQHKKLVVVNLCFSRFMYVCMYIMCDHPSTIVDDGCSTTFTIAMMQCQTSNLTITLTDIPTLTHRLVPRSLETKHRIIMVFRILIHTYSKLSFHSKLTQNISW